MFFAFSEVLSDLERKELWKRKGNRHYFIFVHSKSDKAIIVHQVGSKAPITGHHLKTENFQVQYSLPRHRMLIEIHFDFFIPWTSQQNNGQTRHYCCFVTFKLMATHGNTSRHNKYTFNFLLQFLFGQCAHTIPYSTYLYVYMYGVNGLCVQMLTYRNTSGEANGQWRLFLSLMQGVR